MSVRKGKNAKPTLVHVDRKRELKRDPEREQQFDDYFEEYKKQSLRSAVLHEWEDEDNE